MNGAPLDLAEIVHNLFADLHRLSPEDLVVANQECYRRLLRAEVPSEVAAGLAVRTAVAFEVFTEAGLAAREAADKLVRLAADMQSEIDKAR